jgi:hypothetical protein
VAKKTEDPDELVAIVHKDHDGIGRSTRRQLDGVWKSKGWRLATKAEVSGAEVEPNPDSTPQIGPETPLDEGNEKVAQAGK